MNPAPDRPPRFVLIRGLAREAGHWRDFDRALLSRFPSACVERHDLPGNGDQRLRSTPLRIDAIAEDLRARVNQAGAPAPILIAVSLGAMACIAWLQRWPDDPVRGLVAINTSVGGLCRPWQRIQPRGLMHVLHAIATADPLARERRILALTSSRFGQDLGLARAHAAIHEQRPIARLSVARQLIAAAAFRASGPLPGSTPMLLLESAGDRLVDPICSQRIAASFAAHREVHPSAGHDLSLDDPQWAAARIAAWVERRSLEPE